VAAGLAFAVRSAYGQGLTPLPRLLLEISVLLVTFIVMLLFATGQKALYMDLIRGLRGPSSGAEKSMASA
jgi:hypothetical protein